MPTGNLVKRWEVKPDNDNAIIGRGSVREQEVTNMIAYCSEVYPDFLMAKITSQKLGTRVLPYTPESGIRKGTTVLIQIASGVPRITTKLYFGFRPESIAIMDVDFSKNKRDAIYKNASTPGWSESEGEHYGHMPVIIKHEPGEKIYNVDFQGLKIGYTKVTLFYHPSSRIELYKGHVDIIGINSSTITKAGSKRYVFDNKTKEPGYVVEKTTTKEDDIYFDALREYRGNVSKAMSDDELVISAAYPSDASSIIASAIYMMVVLDKDSESHKRDMTTVDHTYKNRKLSIVGSSGDEMLHKKIKSKTSIPDDFLKTKAITATLSGKDISVTYIKAISVNGDVYEFNSGKKILMSSGDTKKIHGGKKNSEFSFGDVDKYTQRNISSKHYPVSEESINTEEYFGTKIVNNKGDVVQKNYRREINTKIFSKTTYEVDNKSDIETMETKNSPIIQNQSQYIHTEYKKAKNVNRPIQNSSVMTDKGTTVRTISDMNSTPFSVVKNKSGNRTEITLTDSGFQLETKNTMMFKSKGSMLIDTPYTTSTGLLSLENGLYVKGDFYLNADNIIMDAKKYFVVVSENSLFSIDENINFIFGDSFTAQSSSISAPGEDSIQTGLQLTKDSAGMQASKVNIFGVESLNASAVKYASYGAKKADYGGLQNV